MKQAKPANSLPLDAYKRLLAQQEKNEHRARPRHQESNLQKTCVAWFRAQYPDHALMLFAVPNGGGRSRIEGAIMKGEGVTAGVADLILLEARGGYGSLCIEMKTRDRASKQRPSQKAWQAAAERAGNKYAVVRTFEAFRDLVKEYMAMEASRMARITSVEIAVAQARMDRAREDAQNERKSLNWR
jgi:hypothetical protein